MFEQRPDVGYQLVARGWKLTVDTQLSISVKDPYTDFADVGKIDRDAEGELVIHYGNPERVPKDVRTAVKILARKLARGLQYSAVCG
jgi:hypothetical protein